MSKEAFFIKGDRSGLSLQIPEDLEFAEVINQLRTKLASAHHFFAGATVVLTEGVRKLEPAQKVVLESTIKEFGMQLETKQIEQKPESTPVRTDETLPDEETLLQRRTIRSGQKIRFSGNVVIVGDVNPGAEIVCSGDILVLGALRGVAHAGCNGNTEATVFAFRLEPTQLRIAQYISRAPDGKVLQPLGPEVARITENVIRISAYS